MPHLEFVRLTSSHLTENHTSAQTSLSKPTMSHDQRAREVSSIKPNLGSVMGQTLPSSYERASVAGQQLPLLASLPKTRFAESNTDGSIQPPRSDDNVHIANEASLSRSQSFVGQSLPQEPIIGNPMVLSNQGYLTHQGQYPVQNYLGPLGLQNPQIAPGIQGSRYPTTPQTPQYPLGVQAPYGLYQLSSSDWPRAQVPLPNADSMLYGAKGIHAPVYVPESPQSALNQVPPSSRLGMFFHGPQGTQGTHPSQIGAIPQQGMLPSMAYNMYASGQQGSSSTPIYYVPPSVSSVRPSDSFRDSRPICDVLTPSMPSNLAEGATAGRTASVSASLSAVLPTTPQLATSLQSASSGHAAGRRLSFPLNRAHEPSFSPTSKTNFKPKQTKKNSNPKINKILGDSFGSRHFSLRDCPIQMEENSLDQTYEEYRKVLGINESRVDITQNYEYFLDNQLEKELLDLFMHKISVFIDIFLPHEIFEKIVSELSLYDDTRMILDSILCLSSLIYQRMSPEKIDPMTPLKYYQRSVNSIRHHLNKMEVENCPPGTLARCLLSTNLLCIYELFFVAIDSTYVKGAGSILISIMSKHSKSVSLLKSSPFYSSCLWATFVCDIILSLKLESPCVYCPDRIWKTLDPIYFKEYDDYTPHLEAPKGPTEDCALSIATSKETLWWLQKILILFSQIIIFSNLMEVITKDDYMNNRELERWQKLKANLEEYETKMPLFLEPLINQKPDDSKQFPTIFFKDEQTATIGINFKLAKLCLHSALFVKVRVSDTHLLEPEMAKYPPGYSDTLAKDLAGIMQTYDCNLKLWPVNIHALRQASKHIETGSLAHDALKNLTARVVQVCQTRLFISGVV